VIVAGQYYILLFGNTMHLNVTLIDWRSS